MGYIGKYLLLLFVLSWQYACNSGTPQTQKTEESMQVSEIIQEQYELFKPNFSIKAVLILFGGYPETPDRIKREFNILDHARDNGIAVIFMNFNKRLWLEQEEKEQLSKTLEQAINDNDLPYDNIYIGGFSSGGNVSLLLSNYLIRTKANVQPKGVFVVDSPIDLLELYRVSEKNVERNFSAGSVQESQNIIQTFDSNFGTGTDGLANVEKYSPYTSSTNNLDNLGHLKNLNIRLYTEPDTTWWKENRQNDYEDLNAFQIKKLAHQLEEKLGNQNVELIETNNKGYRANGMRHPHSWSIVDVEELVEWMIAR